MTEIDCYIKTNVSDTFIHNDGDENEFYEWVNDEIFKTDLKDLKVELTPEGIEGVSKVTVSIGEFSDEHELYAIIAVETTQDDDTLAENDPLFDYFDKEAIPQYIKAFNEACNVTFPMTKDDDFGDMTFDGEHFYSQVYKAGDDYKNTEVKAVKLTLFDEFEVDF